MLTVALLVMTNTGTNLNAQLQISAFWNSSKKRYHMAVQMIIIKATHIRSPSTSLVVRTMLIVTMRYLCAPTRIAKMKQTVPRASKDVDRINGAPIHC